MKIIKSFGTRWERTFERRGQLEVQVNLRDLWVGVFVDPRAVYVCPLPCVVLRFSRGSTEDPMTFMREEMAKAYREAIEGRGTGEPQGLFNWQEGEQ